MNKNEETATKIIEEFNLGEDAHDIIVDHLEVYPIDWSGLCDTLGVPRRHYRAIMQKIYADVHGGAGV